MSEVGLVMMVMVMMMVMMVMMVIVMVMMKTTTMTNLVSGTIAGKVRFTGVKVLPVHMP